MPAAFVMTIRLLHPTRLGLRNTQLVGFVAAALSFGVLAAVFGGARQTTWALGLAFGFMIFSLSLGTMVTTYVLPQVKLSSLVVSDDGPCRQCLHHKIGLS